MGQVKGEAYGAIKTNHLSDSLLLNLVTVLVSAFSYIYVFVVGRRLGPAAYSDFGAGIALFGLVGVLNQPARVVANHFARKYHLENRPGAIKAIFAWLHRRFLYVLLPLLLASLFFADALSGFLRIQVGSQLIAVVMLMTYVAFIMNSQRGIISGKAHYGPYILHTLTEALLRLLAGTCLLWLYADARLALLGYVFGYFGSYLVGQWLLRDLPESGSQSPSTEGVGTHALPVLIMSLSFLLLFTVDTLVVKKFLPATEAGLYLAAGQFARFTFFLSMPISTVVINLSVTGHQSTSKAEHAALRKKVGQVFLYFAAAALAYVVVMVLLGGHLVTLTFGERFLASQRYLWPLGLGMAALSISFLIAHFAVSQRRHAILILPTLAGLGELVFMWFFHGSLRYLAFSFLYWQLGLLLCMTLAFFGMRTR